MVLVVASTQRLTAHAGLVLVRELADRLGVGGLLDGVTVKKRGRGYSPAQAILGLCETLIAGGECLDDVALLRIRRRSFCAVTGCRKRRCWDAFCVASASAISGSSTGRWTRCLRACIRCSLGRR